MIESLLDMFIESFMMMLLMFWPIHLILAVLTGTMILYRINDFRRHLIHRYHLRRSRRAHRL